MTPPSEAPPILPIVGREQEWAELEHTRDSGRPELIAVYGRRRVGKTFLIRRFFGALVRFDLTGARKTSQLKQLNNFTAEISKRTGIAHARPRDWQEALAILTRYLEGLPVNERQVVFFDEIPWLASRRSGFLPAFEHFWNSWGMMRSNLMVVICGSAASWMITKVLKNRGGLHDRVTRKIQLAPFTLGETERFLHSRRIELNRRQILELYMAIGGIPYYLDYVRKGRSAAQIIDDLLFAPKAPLADEFEELYAALFEHYERHLRVVRALARKHTGLTRSELARATRIASGGNLTTVLDELEKSDFICQVDAFGRTSRDPLYRLIDEFTLFYLKWVEGKRQRLSGAGQWTAIHHSPAWQAWTGYTFENVCFRHVLQIKHALGIAGVQSGVSSWRSRPSDSTQTGAQIDLLIDRKDDVINVCEMKFCSSEFVIDKRYAAELRNKLQQFRTVSRTKKALFLTMVTTQGVKSNPYKVELVQNEVLADALFSSLPLRI